MIDRAGSAQRADFVDLFETEYRRLFATMCLVTGNSAEAEEVVQDAFVRVWERWSHGAEISHPVAYLYRTAINVVRSRARRIVRATRLSLLRPVLPEDPYQAVVDRHVLLQALAGLTPRQRLAVVLVDLLGMSSSEAGRSMHVRAVTVRVLLSQARAAIRVSLEEEDG
jgi:RNA polymerase sigma-70 factor (ECF subfamily)